MREIDCTQGENPHNRAIYPENGFYKVKEYFAGKTRSYVYFVGDKRVEYVGQAKEVMPHLRKRDSILIAGLIVLIVTIVCLYES